MTLARISRPSIVWWGRRLESAMVSPPKPHPMSSTVGTIVDISSSSLSSVVAVVVLVVMVLVVGTT